MPWFPTPERGFGYIVLDSRRFVVREVVGEVGRRQYEQAEHEFVTRAAAIAAEEAPREAASGGNLSR